MTKISETHRVKDQWILDSSILIVDDNLINLEIYEIQLRGAGYHNIASVSDPEKALEFGHICKPDLVILDIMMPELNGFEVMEQLRKAQLSTMILAVTANHTHGFQLKALACGAQDFLTKPYQAAVLLARIHNMLMGHLAKKWLSEQNNTLETIVQERTIELRKSRFELIAALGRAAKHRDQDTANHTIRVGKLAHMMGIKLGLPSATCDILRYAAPMHDIGKIETPDHILFAPRRLDSDEMEIMRRHARTGALIIGQHHADPLLLVASDIALSHHEKWDGSGYPDGVRGQAIPLSGRIVALVDVFDALTTCRPYKISWSLEQAFALIRKERGKHFDPQLGDAFLDLISEIIAIKQQYPDTKKG
ncbi:MAG: response regulator [Nitrospirae bacterium]|nr:response regulator [Magnetococcales bacterium]HAT50712.1 two-component system response regulator [Alphaproteobacteria bacterium]